MTTHDWASRHAETVIGSSLTDLLADMHRCTQRIAEYHAAYESAAKAYEHGGGPAPYTVKEAHEALGVSESTIRDMVHDGRLARVPGLPETMIRIPRASVARLLNG